MAKIKSITVPYEGEDVNVTIYCNVHGTFYTKLKLGAFNKVLIEKANDLASKSLNEFEANLTKLFEDYDKANKKRELCIAVRFRASGAFIVEENGQVSSLFTKKNFKDSFSDRNNLIMLSYKILIKESIGNKVQYFDTVRKKDVAWTSHDGVEDFYKNSFAYSYLDSGEVEVPYSKNILDNLESIISQLRKASFFLATLLGSEEVANVLSGETMKRITE